MPGQVVQFRLRGLRGQPERAGAGGALGREVMAARVAQDDGIRPRLPLARAPVVPRGTGRAAPTAPRCASSGDGEPTLCPNFEEAVEAVVHVRAMGDVFQDGAHHERDRAGLPAGRRKAPAFHAQRRNLGQARWRFAGLLEQGQRRAVPLDKIMANILAAGPATPRRGPKPFPGRSTAKNRRRRKLTPSPTRLLELETGARRFRSCRFTPPSARRRAPECTHLPLRGLSRIAHTVRQVTGLKAEVFSPTARQNPPAFWIWSKAQPEADHLPRDQPRHDQVNHAGRPLGERMKFSRAFVLVGPDATGATSPPASRLLRRWRIGWRTAQETPRSFGRPRRVGRPEVRLPREHTPRQPRRTARPRRQLPSFDNRHARAEQGFQRRRQPGQRQVAPARPSHGTVRAAVQAAPAKFRHADLARRRSAQHHRVKRQQHAKGARKIGRQSPVRKSSETGR